MVDKIARGEEKYGGKISIERPWNCAPDALSRYEKQMIPFQQCCIEYVLMLDKIRIKFKWA